MNSKFEIAKRELHAKLLCRRARTRGQVTMAGRGAWLRCPWAAARPGRSARGRRQGLAAVPVGGGRAWLRCPWAAARPGRATHRHPDRLEAAARPAGPGRGAGGRRQGLAGLRDRPLRAKLACGDLAGGRARRRPEHQRCHTATTRGMDGERAGRPRGGRRSVGGTSDNSRIYSPARRSTSCMMRPHTALTHATAATPRTRERQGRICRKSSKP